jgi:tetratricopeptide (TPR) repeat protein
MNNMNSRFIAWIMTVAVLLPMGAQAAYEDVGVGARTTGLGNAYTGVADDVYSVYYNPAGLAVLERPEFGTTYSKLMTGLSDGSNIQNSFMAYAHPIEEGRRGTAGAGWNYFTAGGLYTESQFIGSYARSIFAATNPDRYYLGGNVKLLSRSIGGTGESANSISNTGVATNTPDPVLAKASKTNIDSDLGFLWRVRPRWTVGVMIQHVMEPNVGFSDNDRLGRNLKFGGAYKTPFSTLSGDLRMQSAPDGTTDKIAAIAAEKWLPTLLHGSFGIRGSLSLGSRDFRQMATGLSYKVGRMQFDYGFALPLGGMSATSGSHRMGLTLRFGRGRQDAEAFNEAILENLRDLAQVGTPEFHYQVAQMVQYKRTAIDELLRQAKLDASAGRYADASDKLTQAQALTPDDEAMKQSQERMKIVADIFPTITGYQTDASQAALYEGAFQFVTGNAKNALQKVVYAGVLNSGEARIERLAQAIEEKAGITRDKAVPVFKPEPKVEVAEAPSGVEKLVGGLMALMEVAMRERDFERVVKLANEILQVDPSNGIAFKRLGSSLYALKRNADALNALRAALRLEKDSDERGRLKGYIGAITSLIEKARQEATSRAVVRTATPRQIEDLYDMGVALYSQGKLEEAAATFRKLLNIEPNNVPARRALDRVQTEILQTGGGR